MTAREFDGVNSPVIHTEYPQGTLRIEWQDVVRARSYAVAPEIIEQFADTHNALVRERWISRYLYMSQSGSEAMRTEAMEAYEAARLREMSDAPATPPDEPQEPPTCPHG